MHAHTYTHGVYIVDICIDVEHNTFCALGINNMITQRSGYCIHAHILEYKITRIIFNWIKFITFFCSSDNK